MQAVILIGIQASGKSTFYQRHFADTHIRINLDMLKTRHRERVLVEACLAAKQSFVVDNTNVTRADRARYIPLARAAGFRVIGYYIESSVADAIRRNRQRTPRKVIPPQAIGGTRKRLELPSYDEGFDELYLVSISEENGFAVRPWQDSRA